MAATIAVGLGVPLGAQPPARPDTTTDAPTRGSASWAPQVLGTQIDVIAQRLAPFHSPYQGPNSLVGGGDHAVSDGYGV